MEEKTQILIDTELEPTGISYPDISFIVMFAPCTNEGIRLILPKHQRALLRNIVMDAKALYDGYPSKHQSEIYLFIKALLRIL